MQTVPMLKVEVLNSAHASCLELEEQLWAPCEGHVSKLAVRPCTHSPHFTGQQTRLMWMPVWTAWEQIFGCFFFSPLQRLLLSCESGIFYYLSSSAPDLFYSYPKLQRDFYDLFHNAFPRCFGEQAENPIYDQVHSHHSVTEYAQLEGTPRITGPTLGTANDGKYLMWSNLYSASTTQPGL